MLHKKLRMRQDAHVLIPRLSKVMIDDDDDDAVTTDTKTHN